MKTNVLVLIGGGLIGLTALCVPAFAQLAAQESSAQKVQIEAGLLECRGAATIAYGFGSSRKVSCEFRPTYGVNQYYTGTLDRAGLDFGVSDQGSMLWMVLAAAPQLGPGGLTGQYMGVTSGMALGPGFSANILLAKDASAGVALQPLSISADSGLSITLAGVTLTLSPTKPPRH